VPRAEFQAAKAICCLHAPGPRPIRTRPQYDPWAAPIAGVANVPAPG
jgi:hypothetical protein